ncbi:TPA: phage tail protein, partial [Pasteurella multocida]|nr:phage tail protein [Pasteurella multocida]
MERFNFNVEMNYDVQHEPLVNQVQFGDNYSQ